MHKSYISQILGLNKFRLFFQHVNKLPLKHYCHSNCSCLHCNLTISLLNNMHAKYRSISLLVCQLLACYPTNLVQKWSLTQNHTTNQSVILKFLPLKCYLNWSHAEFIFVLNAFLLRTCSRLSITIIIETIQMKLETLLLEASYFFLQLQ